MNGNVSMLSTKVMGNNIFSTVFEDMDSSRQVNELRLPKVYFRGQMNEVSLPFPNCDHRATLFNILSKHVDIVVILFGQACGNS